MKVFLDASLVVYLNIPMKGGDAEVLTGFYSKLVREQLFTDLLVLDEAIYVSARKYGVKPEQTIELIDRAVLPHVELLSLGLREYQQARKHIVGYGLTPSDAIHLAVMDNHGIGRIATEDQDYERTHVKRMWF